MADNKGVTPGTGATFATDEIGGVDFPRVKNTWGADGTATDVSAAAPMPVVQTGALPAGTANIGDVDVLTVPADPFGANADAASATGSISAKLRFMSVTGIPITGTVTVGTHAVTVASGGVASGAIASGAVASGAFASGSIASGAIAAGAIAAGATSIADNEDVASADGDRGVKILFKRLDSPANASGTSGDYEQPQMAAGRVWASTVVTDIIPGTGATNLGAAEDAAHTTGDVGVMALGVRQDTPAALAGTTGDYIPFSMDATGNLRVALPDSQLDGSEYETVPASQTTQSLGATGAVGDYLDTLVCVVATAATAQVQIKDGSNGAITVLPNSPGAGVGTYHVSLGIVSIQGAWQVTTGAGVSVVATGNFT